MMRNQPLRRALRRAVGGLALIALIAVAGLVSTWDPSGSSEAAVRDASLNVLAVVLIGTAATLAVNELQEARADERRIDERAADFAQRLVSAYNGVKKVRRMLLAEVHQDSPVIGREAYLRHMNDLCDFQLEFESLSKRAPGLQARITGKPDSSKVASGLLKPIEVVASSRTVGSRRSERIARLGLSGTGAWNAATQTWPADKCSLKGACDQIEHNLNELVKEFQERLHRVSQSSSQSAIEVTPLLAVFIWDTDCFRARITRYRDGSLTYLDERLLRTAG